MATRNKKQSKKLKIQSVAKHLLVPHKGNGYRPHLIRRHGIAAIVIVLFFVQFAYTLIATGRAGVLGKVTEVSLSGLLQYTNEARAEHGLKPLTINNDLNKAATLKAQNMLAEGYWAHQSPSGIKPWKWLSDVGYDYDVAGENLAKNFSNSEATVAAWLASESHRQNVLGSYNDVGFAVMNGELNGRDTSLVVAFYGRPAESVQGANAPLGFAEPQTGVSNPLVYFGSALQSINPATLAGLAILALAFMVSITAYAYRNKMPKKIRSTWRKHHSIYKAAGFACLSLVVVFMSSAGRI